MKRPHPSARPLLVRGGLVLRSPSPPVLRCWGELARARRPLVDDLPNGERRENRCQIGTAHILRLFRRTYLDDAAVAVGDHRDAVLQHDLRGRGHLAGERERHVLQGPAVAVGVLDRDRDRAVRARRRVERRVAREIALEDVLHFRLAVVPVWPLVRIRALCERDARNHQRGNRERKYLLHQISSARSVGSPTPTISTVVSPRPVRRKRCVKPEIRQSGPRDAASTSSARAVSGTGTSSRKASRSSNERRTESTAVRYRAVSRCASAESASATSLGNPSPRMSVRAAASSSRPRTSGPRTPASPPPVAAFCTPPVRSTTPAPPPARAPATSSAFIAP